MIVYDKNIFGSNREIDSNGYLRVDSCNITKTQVAPYLGREIPGWKDMGLDAEQIYYVLRPEDELRKAVPTFNNLPLTREHIEVDVENVPKDKIVGSLGDHAEYADGYLKNNLIVYDQKDIDLIMSGKKKELSCGYRYTPVREHGTFDGQEYDFIMKDIIGNHVALVKEGRAGHDVVVSDTIDKVKEKFMNLFRRKPLVEDEKKDDDVEWITVNGNHIPVGKGQSKEEAVKSFVESKKKSSNSHNDELDSLLKTANRKFEVNMKEGNLEAAEKQLKAAKSIAEKIGGEMPEQAERLENFAKRLEEAKESSKESDFEKRLSSKLGDYANELSDEDKRFLKEMEEKGFNIPSNEEFKKITGKTYQEFNKKYPSPKGKESSKEEGDKREKAKTTNDANMSEQEKVGVVMKEFKEGELKSGSGEKVTDPKQAIAIALSEADKMAKDKDIPDEQEKPEKAGDKDALVKGEEEMTEEVKEALAEDAKKAEEAKEAEDACAKDEGEKKDLEGKEKEAFAEGVDYGEKKEKEEPKKLDSEHESEGTKKADEEEAEKKKEAEDEDKKEDKKEEKKEMAKDSAMAMDIDAIKQAVREEMKADFNARECARKAVRSVVGDVNVMSFDSAEDIYKFACEKAGMDLNDIVSYKDAFKGLTAGRSKLALDASPKCGSNEECFKNIRIA